MEILGLRILQCNSINQIPTVIELEGKEITRCIEHEDNQNNDETAHKDFNTINIELVRELIIKKIQHYLTFNSSLYYDLALEFLTSYGRIAIVYNCNMYYIYTQEPIPAAEKTSYFVPVSHGMTLACENTLAPVGKVDIPEHILPDTFNIKSLSYHFDTAHISFEVNQTRLMNYGYAYMYKAACIDAGESYLLKDLPDEIKQISMLLALNLENETQLLENIKELSLIGVSSKTVADFFVLKSAFKDIYKYYYLSQEKSAAIKTTDELEVLQPNDLITVEDLLKRNLYGANIMVKSMHMKSSAAHKLNDKTSFDFPAFYARRELILKLPLKLYNEGVLDTCINYNQQYLAKRFINKEVVVDTALVTFIVKDYIKTDTKLVDVKAKLVSTADRFSSLSRQPLHDLALYMQSLIYFAEKQAGQEELFDYFISSDDLEAVTNHIKIITNLLLMAKPSCKLKLVQALLMHLKTQGKINTFESYQEYLKKDATLNIYSAALEECNKYTSIDLKTLRRAANHNRILQMTHHEIMNAFTPNLIKGKDFCKIELFYYVKSLLRHSGKPSKEQKALYFKLNKIAPIKCRDYSLLSEEAYKCILELIFEKDKFYASVFEALPDYEVEVLDANDYRNLITGDATNCCMSAGTKKQIVYTYAEAFNQVIITNRPASRIVLDSVIWKDLFGYFVYDNIEAIQVNLVNAEIYKILLFKMAKRIMHIEGLKGFLQGINYNDLELYKAETIALQHPTIALDRKKRYYHNFYTDASEVKAEFEEPITKMQFKYSLPIYINAEDV